MEEIEPHESTPNPYHEFQCRGCGYMFAVYGGQHDGSETCPRCLEGETTRHAPTLDDYDRFQQ